MFKKILVPLDGSELAAKILPQVTGMAKCMNSHVILLHVCYFSYFAVYTMGGPLPAKMERPVEGDEARWCASFLGNTAKKLQEQGVEVNTECVEGVPVREIIASADTNNVDLIAMATHGRGEVAWVVGSKAEKVVTHATVPTLLFRVIEPKPPVLKKRQVFMP